MATVRDARERNTKSVKLFRVGDAVLLVALDGADDIDPRTDKPIGAKLHPGDLGIVRRVVRADPRDRNSARLLFDVQWKRFGRRFLVGAEEIVAVAADEDSTNAWLRRQLAGLRVAEA